MNHEKNKNPTTNRIRYGPNRTGGIPVTTTVITPSHANKKKFLLLQNHHRWIPMVVVLVLIGIIVMTELLLLFRTTPNSNIHRNNNDSSGSTSSTSTTIEGTSRIGKSLSLFKQSVRSSRSSSSSSNRQSSIMESYQKEVSICNTRYDTNTNATIMSLSKNDQFLECQWVLCQPFTSYIPNDRDTMVDPTTTTTNRRNILEQQLCHPFQQQPSSSIPDVRYRFVNPLIDVTRYVCQRNIPISGSNNSSSTSSNSKIVSSKECYMSSIRTTTTSPQSQQSQEYQMVSSLSNVFPVPPIELSTTISKLTMEEMTQLAQYQIPIQLRFSSQPNQALVKFDNCDIPCYHDNGGGTVATRYVFNTPYSNNKNQNDNNHLWTIIFSMEGPQYYNQLYINTDQWKQNSFYSTTSYHSEIPLPYYSKAEYTIFHTNFVPYDTGIKAAVFLARNCNSLNNREQLIQDMISSSSSSSFRIDAVSSCLHNIDPPNGMSLDNKVAVMQQYLFYLAFENQCEEDYITEKLWGPLVAGTIPVYYGAPNVKDHVPDHSIIHVADYPTTQHLMNHLIEVSNNRTLYESYHAWRFQPIPDHFRHKYEITDVHSTCRTCRWAYARIHGTGWNHTTQSLRPLQTIGSRQACLSSSSLSSSTTPTGTATNQHQPNVVNHPFIEEWVDTSGHVVSVAPVQFVIDDSISSSSSSSNRRSNSNNNYANDNTQCRYPLNDSNHMIDINHGRFHRVVDNYDGVIDFTIIHDIDDNNNKNGKTTTTTSSDSGLQLQFIMPTLNQDQIIFRLVRDGVWHIQDTVTRYTIVAVPPVVHHIGATSSMTTNHSVVQYNARTTNDRRLLPVVVHLTRQSIQKLRIIVEDIDTIHKNADQMESYFGKLMTDDYLYPMEQYVLVPSSPQRG